MSSFITIIRWLLSHLTLIVVLSLILYVYWNYGEFGPESEQAVAQVASDDVMVAEQYSAPVENKEAVKQNLVNVEPVYPSDLEQSEAEKTAEALSENEKSIEKHAIIKNEDKNTLIYPDDIEKNTNALQSTAETSISLDMMQKNQQPESSDNVMTNSEEGLSKRKEVLDKSLSDSAKDALIALDTEEGQESQALNNDTTISQLEEPEQLFSKNENVVSYTDKNIQEQIREKQKQLSNQMVALISVTMEKFEPSAPMTVTDVEPIEPVIETSEQSNLLQEARQAFEQSNYKIAEEKYLQLMDQLPELPDVVGELAKVYKTQNRQLDYIAMNTQFVKRLTEHFRFDEAWGVVSETNKIDQQSANKQRRIIYNKQKELNHK